MFRVYDNYEKEWVLEEDFCVSSFDDLYIIKPTKFGKDKIEPVSESHYTVHRYIEANDKYGNLIFEGDIVQHVEDKDIKGVVAYYAEHATYYVFDEEHQAYYRLIGENRDEMIVVGNVFDGIIASDNSTDIDENGDNNDSN